MVDTALKETIIRHLPGGSALFDEPMARHTSLRIGGPAEVFIKPENAEQTVVALRLMAETGAPVFPLGGGTNILVGDRGIDGAVLSLSALSHIERISDEKDRALLKVGAGTPLMRLVSYLKDEGLAGLEGLAGIPGQVGGSVAGNAGSFGAEMKDAVVRVGVAMPHGSEAVLRRDELSFSYRSATLPDGAVIIWAELSLAKDAPEAVRRRTRDNYESKKASQPLGQPSAGCVFKNPPGDSAGRLIEAAGMKGARRGAIEVSTVHAGFFVNRGGGTASDFEGLMEEVARKVRETSGVELETEIRKVGR